jgi:dTDP-glucose 4,6-dehydratase
MILSALERKPLPVYGAGLNVRDWLYVGDHCEAIWAVIERGRLGETYNVGGRAELRNIDTVRAICAAVAEQTGVPCAELEQLITFVADRPGHDLRYAIDASKLERECGWAPRETFASGLHKTVRFYREQREWVTAVRSGEYRAWMETNYGTRLRKAPEPGSQP